MKYYFFIGLIFLLLISCENKPKVISPSESDNTEYTKGQSTGVFDKTNNNARSNSSNIPSANVNVHHIEVQEVLPTEKYVYLRVTEGEEEYWVATGKQTVEVGAKYFFKDGLLKTKFESKEYNRVFDKVYLVSKLVPENHAQAIITQENKIQENSTKSIGASKITKAEGSISIKEIIENASALEGKEIQVTGECTKLNANIMGRNWIHLKDGSKDDHDFVITSDQAIPEGHIVTMKGKVGLNVDFGSGYRYDLLIENASLIRE